jgi:hypothetical protein
VLELDGSGVVRLTTDVRYLTCNRDDYAKNAVAAWERREC